MHLLCYWGLACHLNGLTHDPNLQRDHSLSFQICLVTWPCSLGASCGSKLLDSSNSKNLRARLRSVSAATCCRLSATAIEWCHSAGWIHSASARLIHRWGKESICFYHDVFNFRWVLSNVEWQISPWHNAPTTNAPQHMKCSNSIIQLLNKWRQRTITFKAFGGCFGNTSSETKNEGGLRNWLRQHWLLLDFMLQHRPCTNTESTLRGRLTWPLPIGRACVRIVVMPSDIRRQHRSVTLDRRRWGG